MIAAPSGERPSARVCACNFYDGVVHDSCFRRRKKNKHQKKKSTKKKKILIHFWRVQKKMFKRKLESELQNIMMAKKIHVCETLKNILIFRTTRTARFAAAEVRSFVRTVHESGLTWEVTTVDDGWRHTAPDGSQTGRRERVVVVGV